MNDAEQLLEKFARKNMIQWNQESFKRTHSRLHKSIIEAINEALNKPAVSGSFISVCDCCGQQKRINEDGLCDPCARDLDVL
jgi:hypothetical protein